VNHDEAEELLGAYALDAVDGPELEALERHLEGCSRCRAEVAEHREVAVLLASGGAPAPDGVWERIAGALEAAPPPVELEAFARRRQSRTLPRVAAVALVAAALLAAVLGLEVHDQANRIDKLETAMANPLAPAMEAAFDDPGSTLVALTSEDGGTVVRGVVTPGGTAYLRATTLPPLATGRTYQLWGATGGGLVSLAVLGPNPGVVTFRDADYDLFAITAEESPGGVVSSRKPAGVKGTRTG
jgi:hypothetical protein